MNTVKIEKILRGVVGLKGYDFSMYTLSDAEREKWGDAINDALIEAYAEQKWPQMIRTEERQFRPDWAVDVAYTAGMGVLHESKYYDALVDNTGVVPGRDEDTWSEPVEMSMFVQFEQPWEGIQMDATGIDLNRFAYLTDPRLKPDTPPVRGCRFWMDSVLLPRVDQITVWCRFIPKRENFDLTEWADDESYERGDVRYRTATGDCYRALEDVEAGGSAPDSNIKWLRIRIPEFMKRYVKLSVAADEMSEESGRFRTKAAAENELIRMSDTIIDGSGDNEVEFSSGR